MHSLDCCLPETAARTVDWTRVNTVRNRGVCVCGGGGGGRILAPSGL